jgi:hypothetical protein
MITLVVTAAVVILIRPGKVAVLFTGGAHIGAPFWWALSLGLTANIISDYVSLFFIRHWLGAAGRTPIRALFVAPLVGAVIILLVYFAKSLVWVTAVPSDTLATDLYRGMQLDFWKIVHIAFLEISAELGRLRSHGMLLGALAVHLWLPLFALGMLSIKALNSFVWAISFMRWFLKQGRQHPYEAVGHVAAVIVFVVSALIHVLLR